jgi:hypothetical protein
LSGARGPASSKCSPNRPWLFFVNVGKLDDLLGLYDDIVRRIERHSHAKRFRPPQWWSNLFSGIHHQNGEKDQNLRSCGM